MNTAVLEAKNDVPAPKANKKASTSKKKNSAPAPVAENNDAPVVPGPGLIETDVGANQTLADAKTNGPTKTITFRMPLVLSNLPDKFPSIADVLANAEPENRGTRVWGPVLTVSEDAAKAVLSVVEILRKEKGDKQVQTASYQLMDDLAKKLDVKVEKRFRSPKQVRPAIAIPTMAAAPAAAPAVALPSAVEKIAVRWIGILSKFAADTGAADFASLIGQAQDEIKAASPNDDESASEDNAENEEVQVE